MSVQIVSDQEVTAIRAVVKFAQEAAIAFEMNEVEELSFAFLPDWCFQ